jgi:subtilisin family serine protease
VPRVAPGTKVIPVKVCEPVDCFGSAINAGVDYVTSLKKANPSRPIVINESLGGSRLDAVEKAAIDAAIKAGVVMVASAGNEGAAGMGFPGAYEPVISTARVAGWISGTPIPTRPGGWTTCPRTALTRSMWPGSPPGSWPASTWMWCPPAGTCCPIHVPSCTRTAR